jgi:hypothetical protein
MGDGLWLFGFAVGGRPTASPKTAPAKKPKKNRQPKNRKT